MMTVVRIGNFRRIKSIFLACNADVKDTTIKNIILAIRPKGRYDELYGIDMILWYSCDLIIGGTEI